MGWAGPEKKGLFEIESKVVGKKTPQLPIDYYVDCQLRWETQFVQKSDPSIASLKTICKNIGSTFFGELIIFKLLGA